MLQETKNNLSWLYIHKSTNKTYLQIFVPTSIRTEFNTCEMYLIARCRLAEFHSSAVTAQHFYTATTTWLQSGLSWNFCVQLICIIKLKSCTGVLTLFCNTDTHSLPTWGFPAFYPTSRQQPRAITVTNLSSRLITS